MNNRKKILVAVCLLSLCITVGVTSAFLMSSNTRTNSFFIGSNESGIVETFNPPETITKGDVIIKDVKVKNTGSKSYIRMFVAINDNEMAAKLSINFNTKDWTKGSDGYYYYNKVVNKGESTTSLFNKISFNESINNSSKLKIICYSESVQAQGFNNPQSAFNEIR